MFYFKSPIQLTNCMVKFKNCIMLSWKPLCYKSSDIWHGLEFLKYLVSLTMFAIVFETKILRLRLSLVNYEVMMIM